MYKRIKIYNPDNVYMAGQWVFHQGQLWKSLIENHSWVRPSGPVTPGTNPLVWIQVEQECALCCNYSNMDDGTTSMQYCPYLDHFRSSLDTEDEPEFCDMFYAATLV